MVKVRQDAWSHEDDLLLAETVLRHIREGSTQLNAFEEVGDQLNRTSAACGFRWNAEVRQKYDHAIDLAKRQRKEKKRALAATKEPAIPFMPVRSNYPETIESEPAQVSQVKQLTASEFAQDEGMTMDMVIHYLKKVKKNYHASNQSKQTLEQTEKENTMLQEKVHELEDKLSDTENQLQTIQEDYQIFMQIMDRARKMTVLEDQGAMKSPAFRMDKNGNLQQIVQNNQ